MSNEQSTRQDRKSESRSALTSPTTANVASDAQWMRQPVIPELPAPSTFDILPPLHTLLSRLLSDPLLGQAGADQNGGIGSGSNADLTGPPLEPQRLPTEATALKIRIQKARAAVQSLPDVDRSIEEQEEEIAELEKKVERLRRWAASVKEG